MKLELVHTAEKDPKSGAPKISTIARDPDTLEEIASVDHVKIIGGPIERGFTASMELEMLPPTKKPESSTQGSGGGDAPPAGAPATKPPPSSASAGK